jgi:PRTRC genetic system ThiF family protein
LSSCGQSPVAMKAWGKLRLVLVGCGGTGSWLAPSIARLAYTLAEEARAVSLTFVDPDTVEAKNVPRQNFCEAEIGRNKAQSLALRYGTAWGLDIKAVADRFDKQLLGWHETGDVTLLVGCVDNAEGRRALAKAIQERNGNPISDDYAPSLWWLDCGNTHSGGQVLLGSTPRVDEMRSALVRRSYWKALPSPALQRPELLEALPEEIEGTALSCAEIALRNRQSLFVNQAIAAVAAEYLMLLVGGGLRMFGTYIDLPSGARRSYYTTPETLAAAVGRSTTLFKTEVDRE